MERDRTKVLATAIAAIALDRYVLGETRLTPNLMYAGAVVGSILAKDVIVQPIENAIGLSAPLKDQRSMANRSLELGVVAGSTHIVNGMVLQNEAGQSNLEYWWRMGCSAAADVIGEFATDYMTGQALPTF